MGGATAQIFRFPASLQDAEVELGAPDAHCQVDAHTHAVPLPASLQDRVRGRQPHGCHHTYPKSAIELLAPTSNPGAQAVQELCRPLPWDVAKSV